MTQTSATARPHGAYGVEITGVSDLAMLTELPFDHGWPRVEVRQEHHDGRQLAPRFDERAATIMLLNDEYALIDRDSATAVLLARTAVDDGRLIHPFLTVAGSLFAWWYGYDLFHGGAFVADGGAWALCGEACAGKSSILGELADAGHPILSDDLLAVRDGVALAGPRCVDLRPRAPVGFEMEGATRRVRSGERHRLAVGPVRPELPLRGFVFLGWDEQLSIRRLGVTQRMERLADARCAGANLLDLASLPCWELRRPYGFASFEPAVERLLDVTAA